VLSIKNRLTLGVYLTLAMVTPIGVGRWPIGHVSPIGLLLIKIHTF
jgi:hypothetical protein